VIKIEKIKLMGIFIIGLLLISVVSVMAVTYTNNGNRTGNFCWNDVENDKGNRLLNSITTRFGHRYFNASTLEGGLTNAQKLQVFNKVTVNFWNEETEIAEKEDSKTAWESAFKASYSAPMSE